MRKKPVGSLSKGGKFRWLLLLVVLSLLIYHLDLLSWQWWLLIAGFLFYVSGLKRGGNIEMLYPGTIMLVVSGTFLLRHYGVINFPLWRVWPILFGGMGLAFVLMWGVRNSGVWVLVIGGLLLVASGGGFASRSFIRYQTWLREITGIWPLLLLLIVLLIIVSYWRRRSVQKEPF